MFVTHLDKNYLPFGKLYLLSAAKNAPDENIYISAVNLTYEEIEWLKSFHPKVTIANHNVIVPETIEYRRYMQCRITKVLLEVLSKFRGEYKLCIATNVDMLIRKPMDELYTLIKNKDVLLSFDEEHKNLNEILNEVMVFDISKFYNYFLLSFLESYNQMWDNGKIVYRDDQRQLFRVYNNFKDKLNFGSLPIDYTDKFMQKDSHIWSARRHNRFFNYNQFCRELKLPELTICPEGWGVL